MAKHYLFVSWIPCHYQLTEAVLSNATIESRTVIKAVKGHKKEATAAKSEFYLEEYVHNYNYAYWVIPRGSIAPGKVFVFVRGNGIVMCEIDSASVSDAEEFRRVAYDTIYKDIKEQAHIHLFKHRFKSDFCYVEEIDSAKEIEEVEKRAVRQLAEKIYQELENSRDTFANSRNLTITSFFEKVEEFKKDKLGPVNYPWTIIPQLIELRIKITHIAENLYNITGLYTYIDSFKRIVLDNTAIKMDMDNSAEFREASSIYIETIKEVSYIFGDFSLQRVGLLLVYYGLIVGFLNIAASAGLFKDLSWFPIAVIISLIGASLYLSGYYYTRKFVDNLRNIVDEFWNVAGKE